MASQYEEGALTASAITALKKAFVGNATTDTIGFYGTTAIAQRTNAAQAAVVSSGALAISSGFGFTTSAELNNLVSLANELRAALVAVGLIKGS